MIEVFKTNVRHHDHAAMLIEEIQARFGSYHANFDLEDCDKILRIESQHDICNEFVNDLLRSFGYNGEILPDTV